MQQTGHPSFYVSSKIFLKKLALLLLGGRRYLPSLYKHSGLREILLIFSLQVKDALNPISFTISSDLFV